MRTWVTLVALGVVVGCVHLIVLQPGSVLCYFEPANIGDVSQARAGDAVAFECEVQSGYFPSGCRRASRR